MKDSKLITTDIKLGLWAFVEVTGINGTDNRGPRKALAFWGKEEQWNE